MKLGILIILCSLCGWSAAQSGDDAQLAAATERAVRNLYEQVSAMPLDGRISVADFIERTRGRDELLGTLQRARQIGGPRWLDEQTCQVQLEISGGAVARTLNQIAAAKPHRSPIPPDVLARRLDDWKSRVFSTTGSSVAATRVESIVPRDEPAWSRVSDDARRQAIGDAKFDAAMNVLDSIAPVELTGEMTIGEALKNERVADQMHQWFAQCPVTSIGFSGDLAVEIVLSASANDVAATLRRAVEEQSSIEVSEADWSRVGKEIAEKIAPATGRGGVAVEAQTTQARPVLFHDDAPVWLDERLTARGVAPRDESKLHAARVAEAAAIDNLHHQLGELPLDGETTIAQAAEENGRIEDAVQRALRTARVISTDYARPDATVEVTVELELKNLWNELLSSP